MPTKEEKMQGDDVVKLIEKEKKGEGLTEQLLIIEEYLKAMEIVLTLPATLEKDVAESSHKQAIKMFEVTFDTFLESFSDVIFENFNNVIISSLFKEDSIFTTKMNAMSNGFAYLCDVSMDGTVYEIHDAYTSIFDIDSVHTIPFNLGTIDEPCNILLAADLTSDERKDFERILKKYEKVFAWSYDHMPRIGRSIMEHRIPMYPDAKPIKQKFQHPRVEWGDKVKE
ncbi:hypothetical protein GH714_002290 [Hevea brasiliensis]|uniref:Uncharacterized protein n=1 Tax=Hevea brasiliensis TaxID=3981 RepID=A0A6A6KMA8_HEVBR|nr:hypothetical protein GH714_002290 [Hevea brasiliensis]